MEDRKMIAIAICGTVLFFAVMGVGSYMLACARASAYNRITGQHITPWEALVLNPRVYAEPK